MNLPIVGVGVFIGVVSDESAPETPLTVDTTTITVDDTDITADQTIN